MKKISVLFLTLILIVLITSACQSNKPESTSVNVLNSLSVSDESQSIASGRQRTYSGLEYEILSSGTGQRPTAYSMVTVHYTGKLTNGTVFDSSVQRGQPATFSLQQVISGWTEGIPLMQEGSRFRFTIPPHLAYGAAGSPPKIGPNETLIFDVELIRVHH
jgi:FKBP-type peptidyl-prolyl cis-trans isomerase